MDLLKKQKLLLLTLVHPDFLPPVYACAQTLRDLNYDIHILTFDSFVPSEVNIGENITIESIGRHYDVKFLDRWVLRRKFTSRTKKLIKEGVAAVISFCPFSFLTGLKMGRSVPVIYFAMEIADFATRGFPRSPLSHLNNLITLYLMFKADLVATPSVQRSAWLAGRCHLDIMPATIFNTAYLPKQDDTDSYKDIFKKIVPPHFSDKKIVLYTGAVNERLCVFELVEAFHLLNSDDCALIVTGIKDNEYCNSIKEFVKKSNQKDNIFLLPYITREEMLALQANADIGACLVREYDNIISSKMIAPNKVGEYLNKGLFILGVKCEYMNFLEAKGVAALAQSPSAADVSFTLKKALEHTKSPDLKLVISNFVKNYYCMQKQAAPIINFLAHKL